MLRTTSIWILGIILGVSVGPAMSQTTQDLVDDAQSPENVLIHSMGYVR